MTDNQQPGMLQRWWQQRKIHRLLILMGIIIAVIRLYGVFIGEQQNTPTEVVRRASITPLPAYNMATLDALSTVEARWTQEAADRHTEHAPMTATAFQQEVELTRTEALLFASEHAESRINRTTEAQRRIELTVTLRPTLPADASALSVPYEHTFDGVKMMYVPAGCFTMGDDELPDIQERTVCIDNAFWIDRYEVSQEQFRDFEGDSARPSHTRGWDLPVTNITAYEAAAFCEKRGARLPTEAEWEYAARGPDSLRFPRGNELIEGHVNPSFDENGSYTFGYDVIAVDRLPNGASWVGAEQMSGNVWEWTTTPDGFVFKGGSYTSSNRIRNSEATELLRPANRSELKPSFALADRGFRCVRDY